MDTGSRPYLLATGEGINGVYILILFILLMFSALFSASETALTSINKIRLKHLMDEKVKNADKVYKLLEDPNKLITAILIGNNIANILASSIATVIFTGLIKNQDLAVALSTAIMTISVLIFGEITPKIYAAQNAEKISFLVVDFIGFVAKILTPIINIMNKIVGKIMKLIGGVDETAPLITESELRTLVTMGQQEGLLELDESVMISNVFDLGNIHAKDIMVPRTDMIAVPVDIEYEELQSIYEEYRFSRIPVYEDSTDDIIGLLHMKDLLFIKDFNNFNIKKYIRDVFFTYEYIDIDILFRTMQSKNVHFAIVLDEYGGTSGIVTLEDVLEEIVGEIEDEYDTEEIMIEKIMKDQFIIDGTTPIKDINETLGIELSSEDAETLGGYITEILGRFPEQDETVEMDEKRFIIEKINKNRIESVRLFL